MRILDLTTIYPNSIIDSEGRAVQAIDRAWVQLGHSVATCVLRPWAPGWLVKRMPKYRHLAVPHQLLDDQGVKVVFSRYFHIPRLAPEYRFDLNVRFMANQVVYLCRKLNLAGDFVHAQGITSGFAAQVVGKKLGLPFAITLSDDLRHLLKPENRVVCEKTQRVLKEAVSVFVMGPGLYNQVTQFLSPEEMSKVNLVPLGINHTELEQKISTFPRRSQEFAGRIVSVSNLYRLKGIHENLYALALLFQRGIKSWHYTVVGDGPYRPELEQLSEKLGLSAYVNFVGAQPHSEAMRYMYESDIFCMPSWMEAFGQVYAEAAMCGIPSIGCWGNGPEIIIKNNETGLLVPTKDIDALAQAIEFLLTHPERSKEMGIAAHAHIQLFTWERTANTYLQSFSRFVPAV
jgi:glycosyltransferase involved in cell wall biosynthesis